MGRDRASHPACPRRLPDARQDKFTGRQMSSVLPPLARRRHQGGYSMRRLLLAAALTASCLAVAGAVPAQEGSQKAQPAAKALTLDVWPGKAPGDQGEIGPEKELDSKAGKPSV